MGSSLPPDPSLTLGPKVLPHLVLISASPCWSQPSWAVPAPSAAPGTALQTQRQSGCLPEMERTLGLSRQGARSGSHSSTAPVVILREAQYLAQGHTKVMSVAGQGPEAPEELRWLQGPPAGALTGMCRLIASRHQAAPLLPCVYRSQGEEPARPPSCRGQG